MNFGPGTGWCQRCCAGWQYLGSTTLLLAGAGSGNQPGGSAQAPIWRASGPSPSATTAKCGCRLNLTPSSWVYAYATHHQYKIPHRYENEIIMKWFSTVNPNQYILVVSLGEVASNCPEHMSWCLKTASHRGLQLSQPSSWPHLN